MDFRVRPLRRGDVKQVIANYYLRYEEVERNPDLGLSMQEGKPTMKSELAWAKRLLKDIRQRNAIATVAIVGKKIVGMADVRTETIMERQHVGSVGVAINEGYRSMGIGTALMKDLVMRSKGRFEILVLDVMSINKAAMGLYKKLGFKVYGTLPKGYMRQGRRIDHTLMYLRP